MDSESEKDTKSEQTTKVHFEEKSVEEDDTKHEDGDDDDEREEMKSADISDGGVDDKDDDDDHEDKSIDDVDDKENEEKKETEKSVDEDDNEEDEEEEEEFDDVGGNTITPKGMEVPTRDTQTPPPPFVRRSNVSNFFLNGFNSLKKFKFQINKKSAGNVKRTKAEKENDPEEPDEFGYTSSKFT